METGAKVKHSEVSAIRTILDMAGAYAVPSSLQTDADLGVADALGETRSGRATG